jgi:sulfate transport system substrate-binding protein
MAPPLPRALPLLLATACTGGGSGPTPVPLALAAYTTPREAFAELLPAFAAAWGETSGAPLSIDSSFQASGAQARAVVGGLEADVVALSLEPDVRKIADAGLITSPWQAGPTQGRLTTSLVVLAVRPGNPKNIRGWEDLARPDVEVLTPNPRTSGGAMWNIAALVGAVERGRTGRPADEAGAQALLTEVLANVRVMDKGARESMLSFEGGVGDVAITYENEVRASIQAGKAVEMVLPDSTLRIDAPIAVVDGVVDRKGSRAAAEALVAWLLADEAQRVLGEHGFRPADPARAPAGDAAAWPVPADLFTIDDLGGWPAVQARLFADGGVVSRAMAAAPAAKP